MKDRIRELVEPYLVGDSCDQTDAFRVIPRVKHYAPSEIANVLDLGAGVGSSYEPLSKAWPNCNWVGLDIEQSPEVANRNRDDLRFETYNGRSMPFDDDTFDMVFSKQVLEHVRYPDEVISEVSRVLIPGGIFFGSVSQLEPYHSYSIFNWTIYGILEVFSSHDIEVLELLPGIDGASLILRRVLGRKFFSHMFNRDESLVNHLLSSSETSNKPTDTERRSINFKKLLSAGHVVFIARKKQRVN